jgi:glycine dehydrogenase
MPIQRQRLTDLQSGANFISRHIGPREDEMSSMLKTVGASSLEDLMDKVIPAGIRAKQPLNLPVPLSERNALSDLRRIAGRNRLFTSMIGMGYYGCVTPKVILRNILESPGWYTGYTPYQAEVSQGRLEALLNFQQMVSDLTGLELASASLLDEGTAAAEAMAMAHRTSKTGSDVFFVDRDTHPQTLVGP